MPRIFKVILELCIVRKLMNIGDMRRITVYIAIVGRGIHHSVTRMLLQRACWVVVGAGGRQTPWVSSYNSYIATNLQASKIWKYNMAILGGTDSGGENLIHHQGVTWSSLNIYYSNPPKIAQQAPIGTNV